MRRYLIVNADDFNLTQGVSQGIAEAHRRGIVTSTSVLVNLPGLEQSRDLARKVPGLGTGLHLNLTFGRPVLPPDKVPSLVDATGCFIRERGRLATSGDPAQIREELRAQAERFEAIVGHRPGHLDSHHHIHRHPRIFEAVLDLALTLGVPMRAFTPEMAERIRSRHLPAPDRAMGDVGPEAYWTCARLCGVLEGLEAGVTELMCHPGYAEGLGALSSYSGQREAELRALCDPGVERALRASGIQCITYDDLAAILVGR